MCAERRELINSPPAEAPLEPAQQSSEASDAPDDEGEILGANAASWRQCRRHPVPPGAAFCGLLLISCLLRPPAPASAGAQIREAK